MTEKITEINLTQEKTIEFASITNFDQMHIKCFATTEGVNGNNTKFPRDVLLASYKSFIDQPVWIVPDKYGFPTGHGYDLNTAEFNKEVRKNIGHIKNAYPVVVGKDGQIADVSEMKTEDFPDGELRIITDLVISKFYFSEIAENLKYLHNINDLFFSMEALTKGHIDGYVKECSEINFTGLAIVSNPAFVNSTSIEIAQRKEEEKLVDFEEKYNALVKDYDTVVAENKTLKENSNKAVTLATELADKQKELDTANATIAELEPYKEKVETAEKEALGKERAEKLAKVGVTTDSKELEDKTETEFAEMILAAVDKMKADEGAGNERNTSGVIFYDHSKHSDIDELGRALEALCK